MCWCQLKEGHQEISFPCICSLIKVRKVAVSTTRHYGNTEMPRCWERDQPWTEQVGMREGKGGPLAAAPTPGSPSLPGQSTETVGMGAHYPPCTASAEAGQEKASRDERPGMPCQERAGWGVLAGFCCGCVPVTLCPLLSLIITSILMLCLIIFIDDLSCYKNICQNYCLSCPNNSDYNIPSINYRQLHSQLFPLSLPSISCIISTDKSFVHRNIGLRGFFGGVFWGGCSFWFQ